MKRKRNQTLKSQVYDIVIAFFVFTVAGILCVCLTILSALSPKARTRAPNVAEEVEEILIVPLNGQDPVYTENKYSDWVAISISGSVERDGEFLFDALHHYEDLAQGSQGGFRGFMIDGKYVDLMHTPSPRYRDDHVYRFPYSVYRNIRDTNLHLPKTIGFQMINEAARGLDGEFIVEVSSDPFKYWPERRGR